MKGDAISARWRVQVSGRLKLLWPFVGTMVLILGSAPRLVPIVRECSVKAQTLGRTMRELESLEQLELTAERETLSEKYEAAMATLVKGEVGARDWLRKVSAAAAQAGFEVDVQIGQPERRWEGDPRVEIMPIQLHLKPRIGVVSEQSSSARLTVFLQQTTAFPEWVEFVELSLHGNGEGLSAARVGVRLWVNPPPT